MLSPSSELAQKQADTFVGEADYFGYNLEHGPDTPASERDEPVATNQAAAQFARQHNLGAIGLVALGFAFGFLWRSYRKKG